MGITNTNVKNIEELLISTKTTKDNRYDLIDLYTFSIDANKARRFDDAISIVENDSNYLLFVHITDIISDENYHHCNVKYFAELVSNHSYTHKYDLEHSLVQGSNRKALTLVTLFNKNGELVEYKFIKAIINVDENLNISCTNKIFKSEDITKNSCLHLKKLFQFYGVSKLKFSNNLNLNPSLILLEESMSLYTHLLGMDLIEKNIGILFIKILLKKHKNYFYVKATSPLYKVESYISQLLIHDFVVDNKPSTMDFWKSSRTLVIDFMKSKESKPQKISCKSKKFGIKERRLKQKRRETELFYINYSLDC